MNLTDLLREQIDAMEASLAKGEPHGCRFCMYFDCGKNDSCKCGCAQVSKEKRLIIERLKYLVECADIGEVPEEVSNAVEGPPAGEQ